MKESIQKIVSRRIKKLRIEKSLTQRTLAKAAGLHYTYIAKIEAGKKIPTVKVLCRLAAALEIEMHELLMPPRGRHKRLSQRAKELIRIIDNSSPAEISLYFTLINALNKKKKLKKHAWIGEKSLTKVRG